MILDGDLDELQDATKVLEEAREEWNRCVQNLSDACPVKEGDIVTIRTDGYVYCTYEGQKMKVVRTHWIQNPMARGWQGWKLTGYVLKKNGDAGKMKAIGFHRYRP